MEINLKDKIQINRRIGHRKTFYEQLSRQIHKWIVDEKIPAGTPLPRVTKMAEQLDLNYRTIKAAMEILDEQGVIINKPNRQAVVAIGNPNQISQAKRYMIAYTRVQADPFCVSIQQGIQEFVNENDIDCILLDSVGSFGLLLQNLAHPPTNVDAILTLPFENAEYIEAIRQLLEKGKEIIFIDRYIEQLEVSSVTADHFTGAYLATRHLLQEHKMPVYHICIDTKLTSTRNWIRGWSEAMKEHSYFDIDHYKLAIDIESFKGPSRTDNTEQNIRLAETFFEMHPNDEKYCIFAGNDYAARGIYMVAQKKGLKVGRDIFMVGFGDLPLARQLGVPLSTVDQNSHLVGYEAAKLVFERLSGLLPKHVHRVVPVELKIRQSSLS